MPLEHTYPLVSFNVLAPFGLAACATTYAIGDLLGCAILEMGLERERCYL